MDTQYNQKFTDDFQLNIRSPGLMNFHVLTIMMIMNYS